MHQIDYHHTAYSSSTHARSGRSRQISKRLKNGSKNGPKKRIEKNSKMKNGRVGGGPAKPTLLKQKADLYGNMERIWYIGSFNTPGQWTGGLSPQSGTTARPPMVRIKCRGWWWELSEPARRCEPERVERRAVRGGRGAAFVGRLGGSTWRGGRGPKKQKLKKRAV